MNKKYTPKSNALIKECIKDSTTLAEAFIKASEILGCSVRAIAQHYYKSKDFKLTRQEVAENKKKKQQRTKRTLIGEIQKSPDNLTKAFQRTADKTGYSYDHLISCYYNPDSYLYRGNLGVCFILSSKEKAVYNGKNTGAVPTKVPEKITKMLLTYIKGLFKRKYK